MENCLRSASWQDELFTPRFLSATGIFHQGHVSAEGILHLVNPNLGSNTGTRIFEPRILGSNSGVEFFGPVVSNKKSPLKNSPPRNSPPIIHIKKFTPEFGLKNSHCTSAGPFFRTSSTTTGDRNLQFRGAVSTGGSPLDFLLLLQYLCAISYKTSPLKSGESSENPVEKIVKSCHVCGCHGFFGPEFC